jgi:hypothetical protein
MKKIFSALLLLVAGTTTSLTFARGPELDGCWYRWGATSYGQNASQRAGEAPPACTVFFSGSQVTMTCKGRSSIRVVEASLGAAGTESTGGLELTSSRITQDGRAVKVPPLHVALSYNMDQDKLFTVARGPDLQGHPLQAAGSDVIQSSYRRIPVGKLQCQQVGAGTRDLDGIFNLPKPSAVSNNLAQSIRSNNFDLAQSLLSSGGDINCVNCDANPPLVLAVILQDIHTIDLIGWLLSHKADPNTETVDGVFGPYGGKTGFLQFGKPLADWIAGPQFLFTGGRAIPWLNQFLDAGANVKSVTNDRSTFLHLYAGEAFNLQANLQKAEYAINAVLAKGADINARDQAGYTPLMRGLVGGYSGQPRCPVEQVKLFLALGADVNTVALDGKRAFDIAMGSAAAGDQRCNALLPLLKPQ